jgi:eukaryotic-like serine/threonine-protein kinase
VVLKRIHPHLASNPEFVRMFLDEARTAGDLRHSNVVSVTDVGADGGTYFIVMEYLHGRDLSQVAQRCLFRSEKVPLAHALHVVSEAAIGLDYAHRKLDLRGAPQQIVHRDVSPQNVFVTFDGATKVLDFGIASAVSRTTETEAGVVKGKFGYMSPEQVDGAELDPRSDQFSLGIVLYELLTQKPLFTRKTEAETFRAVSGCKVEPLSSAFPAELNAVVLKALSKNPADRFDSCGDFAHALIAILEKDSVSHSAPRVSAWLKTIFSEHEQPVTATADVEVTRNERLVVCPR